MFRYLGEKIPMSDTDTAVKFGLFLHSVCVFVPTDVTAIQDTVFVHLHAYINAKYICLTVPISLCVDSCVYVFFCVVLSYCICVVLL